MENRRSNQYSRQRDSRTRKPVTGPVHVIQCQNGREQYRKAGTDKPDTAKTYQHNFQFVVLRHGICYEKPEIGRNPFQTLDGSKPDKAVERDIINKFSVTEDGYEYLVNHGAIEA